ncbi:MAG: type 1 glutamine amidotransferase family protein [Aquabacterium sp.]
MAHPVHLFVYDGFADWEAAFAIAGIQQPAFQRVPGRYTVCTVALSQAPVRSMGGVAVLPDRLLDTLTPAESAMLILPGGLGWEEGQHGAAAEMARAFLAGNVPVAAICGATAGLARLGLLNGRRHTSNALSYLKGVAAYEGSDRYEDQPAWRDGPLITAGGMAPLEFAREIFRCLDVYDEPVLAAWYDLYRTGRSEHFARMQQAADVSDDVNAAGD